MYVHNIVLIYWTFDCIGRKTMQTSQKNIYQKWKKGGCINKNQLKTAMHYDPSHATRLKVLEPTKRKS